MHIKKIIKRIVKAIRIPQKTFANIAYLQPNQILAGKRIIITGGGRGIGAAMAEKFVNEGASVLIAGRNEQSLKELAEKIGCKYLTIDVSDVSLQDSFLKNAVELLQGVDVLVNNAGISLHENTFFDVTPESFDKQISVNLKGGYFLSQKIIAMWLEKKESGTILFTSSETGEMADYRPYGFTKAMINSLVQGLAHMFAPNGIRVNAIAPGISCSDMTGYKADGNLYYSKNPLNRLYLPEEVAEMASFLLSDASGCISGQILTCNNGRSINARWDK